MAFANGPVIVTNGLVLALDAADRNSYPGSGTTWADLSSGRNNATLNNGPTFSTVTGGAIVFDGTNDNADFFAPSLGTTTTVEMWCNISSTSNKMFFGWLLYDVYCSAGNVGYNTANGDVYGISAANVTALGLVGNWKHYIFEMRSDVSYTNNKIYVNGASQALAQQLGTETAANRNFNSGNGRIAGWRTDADYSMPMNCASFRVYNRALSAQEILQNYNATKSRFNL